MNLPCFSFALYFFSYFLPFFFVSSIRLPQKSIAINRRQSREPWVCTDREAIKRSRDLCSQYSSFLSCTWNRNGIPKCLVGSGGFAIQASIINTEESGVAVYANCPPNPANATLPLLSPACKVDPKESPLISVVIKLNRNELQYDPLPPEDKQPRFETEVCTARKFAPIGIFDNSSSSFPKLYDIIDADTQTWHEIHNSAWIMERVHGNSAYNILNSILHLEKTALEFSFGDALNKYSALRKRMMFDEYTQAEKEKIYQMVVHSARRGVAEIWLRARYRLSLLDTVLKIYSGMHSKGIHHCDAHLDNIYFMTNVVYEPQEMVRLLTNGDAVFDGLHLYLTLTSTQLEKQLDGALSLRETLDAGWGYWSLRPDNVKLIDNGMTIDIDSLPPIYQGELPCRVFRNGLDDIMSFLRTLRILLSGVDIARQDYRVLPNYSLLNMWKAQLNKLHSTSPETFERIMADHRAQEQFEFVQASLASIEQFFAQLEQNILAVPEMKNCLTHWRSNSDMDARRKRSGAPHFILSPLATRIEEEHHVIGECTIDSVARAYSKAQNVVDAAVQQLKSELLPLEVRDAYEVFQWN